MNKELFFKEKFETLSAREKIVAVGIYNSMTQADIAKKMKVQPTTIGTYIERIASKLEIYAKGEKRVEILRDTIKSFEKIMNFYKK